jgi:hypothetical protein
VEASEGDAEDPPDDAEEPHEVAHPQAARRGSFRVLIRNKKRRKIGEDSRGTPHAEKKRALGREKERGGRKIVAYLNRSGIAAQTTAVTRTPLASPGGGEATIEPARSRVCAGTGKARRSPEAGAARRPAA